MLTARAGCTSCTSGMHELHELHERDAREQCRDCAGAAACDWLCLSARIYTTPGRKQLNGASLRRRTTQAVSVLGSERANTHHFGSMGITTPSNNTQVASKRVYTIHTHPFGLMVHHFTSKQHRQRVSEYTYTSFCLNGHHCTAQHNIQRVYCLNIDIYRQQAMSIKRRSENKIASECTQHIVAM